jgi:glycerol-3-phosphate dehydrogenase subunit C
MAKLTRDKLMTLEAYAKARDTIRADVMAHKKDRNIALGDHVTLIFEDEQTIRYQVQEMLRAEKVFEEAGIQDEIDAYNPLIPDGSNWKATMMIEYEDVEERRHMLTQLLGIEDRVWVQVAGFERVYAIADEDLERATEQKTSAVHFLRFELSAEMSRSLKQGAGLSMGVDHPNYQATIDPVPPAARTSLLRDLQG